MSILDLYNQKPFKKVNDAFDNLDSKLSQGQSLPKVIQELNPAFGTSKKPIEFRDVILELYNANKITLQPQRPVSDKKLQIPDINYESARFGKSQFIVNSELNQTLFTGRSTIEIPNDFSVNYPKINVESSPILDQFKQLENNIYGRFSIKSDSFGSTRNLDYISEIKPNGQQLLPSSATSDARTLGTVIGDLGSGLQSAGVRRITGRYLSPGRFQKYEEHRDRIASFLTLNDRGRRFIGTQTFLQGLNPTFESREYSPFSSFDTLEIGSHRTRHADALSGQLGILGSAIGGFAGAALGVLAGALLTDDGIPKYTTQLRKGDVVTPKPVVTSGFGSELGAGGKEDLLSRAKTVLGKNVPPTNRFKSRVVYQVGSWKDDRELELQGRNYARYVISGLKGTFKYHNPNRYLFATDVNLEGTPLNSAAGPLADLEKNTTFLERGLKFTQNVKIPTNLETNEFAINTYNSSFRYLRIPFSGKGYDNIDNFTDALRFIDEELDTDSGVSKIYFTWLKYAGLNGGFVDRSDLFESATKIDKSFTFDAKTGKRPRYGTPESTGSSAIPTERLKSYLLNSYEELRATAEGIDPNFPTYYKRKTTDTETQYPAFLRRGLPDYTFSRNSDSPKRTRGDLLNMDVNKEIIFGDEVIDTFPENIDLIPFEMLNITTNELLRFRAIISGITLGTSVNLNSKNYIGRADPLYGYGGAERDLSFNLTTYAYSPAEIRPLWIKLNKLEGLCWPDYQTLGGISEYPIAPLARITIGDFIFDQPCMIRSVSFTVDDNVLWELVNGDVNAFADIPDIQVPVERLPMSVQGQLNVALINENRPTMRGKIFSQRFV